MADELKPCLFCGVTDGRHKNDCAFEDTRFANPRGGDVKAIAVKICSECWVEQDGDLLLSQSAVEAVLTGELKQHDDLLREAVNERRQRWDDVPLRETWDALARDNQYDCYCALARLYKQHDDLLAKSLKAMADFCAKVDRGEARSKKSYEAFAIVLESARAQGFEVKS